MHAVAVYDLSSKKRLLKASQNISFTMEFNCCFAREEDELIVSLSDKRLPVWQLLSR